MWILMLEAGVAFFLLVLIVWWTMYSGKKPEHSAHQQIPAQKQIDAQGSTDKLEH